MKNLGLFLAVLVITSASSDAFSQTVNVSDYIKHLPSIHLKMKDFPPKSVENLAYEIVVKRQINMRE